MASSDDSANNLINSTANSDSDSIINQGFIARFSVLKHPFRVFFLAAAIYAMLAVLGWAAFLLGGWQLPVGWSPLHWHSHEMLYGFVTAAIAGFILTAITNWTSAKPLQNGALLALLCTWVAGRLAMWFASWLPPVLVALIDFTFLLILGTYVFYVLWKNNNRRNLILVLVIALLCIGNGLMHIGFISGDTQWLQIGQLLGFDLITLMIAIIAGRITPAFSGNWLRAHGHDANRIRKWKTIEFLSIAGLGLIVILDASSASKSTLSAVALCTAIVHACRWYGWAGWLTWRAPLLWILHLAYLWLVAALVLRGLNGKVDAVGSSVWQHALGVGAIGTMILGVMTRVAVGHTGRPLALLRWGLCIYIAISIAAITRILVAFGGVDFRFGIGLSALAWVVAFALFIIIYGPVLIKPRADGKPG